jgi:hypothetical protein
MTAVMIVLVAVALTIPPAAKVLAIAALVYAVIQGVKQIPALTPYLTGWVAIGVNVALTATGLLIAIPADQLYTMNTLMALVTACLTAAGVHGTVSAMSPPQMLVTTPPSAVVHEAPATLQPESSKDKPAN